MNIYIISIIKNKINSKTPLIGIVLVNRIREINLIIYATL
jgi:hypothetical protein